MAHWIRTQRPHNREPVDRAGSSQEKEGKCGLRKVAHIMCESNENKQLIPTAVVAEVVERLVCSPAFQGDLEQGAEVNLDRRA